MVDLGIVKALLDEVLSGSSRAVVAILVLAIIVLMYELRNAKKHSMLLQDKMDIQRKELLSLVDDMQANFIEKSDNMVDRYHKALVEQQTSLNTLTFILERLKATIPNLLEDKYPHNTNKD